VSTCPGAEDVPAARSVRPSWIDYLRFLFAFAFPQVPRPYVYCDCPPAYTSGGRHEINADIYDQAKGTR